MAMDEQIVVEIGDSSIAKLAKALGGVSGKGGAKGGGGLFGMLQNISGKSGKGLAIAGAISGAIAAILHLVKMLVGSSPMLKQMMNLINFGFMLILRPIGDFIGFMLRPIIVMLLRNVIIPFYKEILPIAQDLGSFIGDTLVAFFNDPTGVIAAGLQGLNTWVTDGLISIFKGEVNWEQIGTYIKEGLLLLIKTIPAVAIGMAIVDVIKKIDWSQIATEWGEVGKAAENWFTNGIASIKANWNSYWTGVSIWFTNGVNSIKTAWSGFWTSVYTWFANGIAKISASWQSVWLSVYSWITSGISSIVAKWSDIWGWLKDWIWNGIQSISAKWSDIWGWLKDWIWNGLQKAAGGLAGAIPHANGGVINEPIFGVGRSGQTYTFGERGSEMVTPLSGGGGGTTVNITVGSISSESDMREFERRVLDIIENANSRRGRV